MTRRPLLHLAFRPLALGFCALSASLALAPCLQAAPAPLPPHAISRQLVKVDVLPLALDDDFAFGKKKLFLFDPASTQSTRNPMILGERQRLAFGAASQAERKTRYGHYFTFWWQANRPAQITIRLEYRQEKLGSYVQAREITANAIPGKKGKTEFHIIGDDYLDDGKIVAWRALLIEEGKIVALTQSALWQ